jgi:nickel-type superoxide dismutase maturation protease
MSRRRGYGRVAVSGDSMRPGLSHGDWLIVRWGAAPRPGDVVVAERPDRPGLLLVKRATRWGADGWWLEGDNPAASHDSWLFGPVPADAVAGVAVARYWPRPRWVGRSRGPLAP